MRLKIGSFIRQFGRQRRGNVLIMTAVAMTVLLGAGGLAVDVGHVMYVKSRVQIVTDAAALAGAQSIADGTAVTVAMQYSATAGNKGEAGSMPVTMYAGYPQLKCVAKTGVPCTGPSNANAIVVVQQATVPLYLGRILGINSISVTTMATASAAGGGPPPLNVMFVLDTTTSMTNLAPEAASSDPKCSNHNATRIDCALAGVRTILPQLWPSIDQIGLMVFPGLKNSNQLQYEYDCSATTHPIVVPYNATSPTPVYQVVGLSTDYRTSDTATSLSGSSNLVKSSRGGDSGCQQGLDVQGGQQTFFAGAITAAQNALMAGSRTGVKNVMILLSDGDANASTAPTNTNECHQAITAAQTAKAAGTLVYAIAYGASISSTSSCTTEATNQRISACSTMQQIASDSSKFYSDTVGGSTCTSAANPVADLVSIFQRIGTSLMATRLIPDDWK